MYLYFAYGLTIQSELEIREFPFGQSKDVDVTIRFGKVPLELKGATRHRMILQGKPGQFQMEAQDVGRFLVRNGNEIIIDRHPETSDEKIIVFTVGSIFAALLQQRQYLTLHASCIKGPQGSVIFVGSSGMGKSTLLSALNRRGYAMIADDITALKRLDDDTIQSVPATPITRLWDDSALELNRNANEGWQVRSDMQKYNLPIENFHSTPVSVDRIFLLSNPGSGDTTVEPVDKMTVFHELKKFTYRKHFLRAMEMDEFHFKFISLLVNQVPVCRLVRPHGEFNLDSLVDIVEAAMAEEVTS